MTYNILMGKSKEAKVEIHLDNPNPTLIPPHVLAGIGNKKVRYANHLNKCFNENPRLLNFLAFIHKTGKEKGDITLISRAKGNLGKMQMEAVKEFLEVNRETLDMMLPYIFRDAGYKPSEVRTDVAPSSEDTSLQTLDQEITHGGAMTFDQLPLADREQILALMKQDQERSANTVTDVNFTEQTSTQGQ